MNNDDAFAAGVSYGMERTLAPMMASTLRNPEQWLLDAFGGSKSTSGVRVTYESALRVAYVYAAQQIISADVARLPVEFKSIEDDGDEIADRSHYCNFIMNGDANNDMSAYEFRETLTHWALLFGNGLAYILRDAMGRATQLIPALPGDVWVERINGKRVYHVSANESGIEPFTLNQRDVLHIRGLGDDLWGHSLLKLARDSFGLSISQDKHGSEHWKNGGRPNIVLKHPSMLILRD